MYRVFQKVQYRKFTLFTNGAISQSDILRHDKYNLHLDVSEVSISYVKGNLSYERERNDGSNGTWMIKYGCVEICRFTSDILS